MVKNQTTTIDKNAPKKLTIDGRVLLCQDGETILETLEREKIQADFNCREGFCGVCRTKLVTGEIDYQLDPLAFIDDDEVLTCCTVPISDIEIKLV
jgi:ferredoxin